MEEAGDLGKLPRAVKLAEYGPKCLPVDGIECLREIDEDSVEVHFLLTAFLLDLSHREDHVHCATPRSKATLSFRQVLFSDAVDQAVEADAVKDLSSES